MGKKLIMHIVRFLPFNWLRSLAQRPLIVINYHSIQGIDPDSVINKNTYRSKAEFEKDIRFLKEHFDIISPEEIIQTNGNITNNGLPKVVLTFDDGLAINYQFFSKILKKYNIKAIFFINPDFIDNRGLHYKRKVNYLLRKNNSESINVVRSQWEQLFKSVGITPSFVPEDLYHITYKKSFIIDQLAHLFQIDFENVAQKQAIYLTSEQIQEMLDDGFYFGGHSMDHPNYNELEENEQVLQSIESIEWVVKQFELKYALFAFPMNDQKISKSVIEQIHREVDVSFGINGMMDDFTIRHIPRITIEQTGQPIKVCLKYEYLKYIFLRMKNGKNFRRK